MQGTADHTELLRRILDLGATTVDTRIMFQSQSHLLDSDGDTLEIIREELG